MQIITWVWNKSAKNMTFPRAPYFLSMPIPMLCIPEDPEHFPTEVRLPPDLLPHSAPMVAEKYMN